MVPLFRTVLDRLQGLGFACMPRGAHRAQRTPDPLCAVPLYAVIDPLPELLQADALPVPPAGHLFLHGAEEALHAGVVGRELPFLGIERMIPA